MGPKERRNAAVKRQQELLNGAKAEGRDLTAEEQREFEEQQTIVDAATREIEAMEQQAEGENQHERGMAEERQRISDIMNLGNEFGIDVRSFITNGNSMDEVRAAVLDQMRSGGAPSPQGRGGVEVTGNGEDRFRAAASDALMLRAGLTLETPAAGAQDFRNMSMRDLAIRCMDNHTDADYQKSSSEIFDTMLRDYANPAAAFPAIMDQTVNKAYVSAYNETESTFEQFCSEGSLKDFKLSPHNYLASSASDFELVRENGELKTEEIKDDTLLPQRKLETYGKTLSLSRQAFINDDIGYVTSIPAKQGRAAKRTINKQVYDILVKNSVIYDGTALFTSAHGNIADNSKGIPNNAAIQAMIIALSMQKDPNGNPVYMRPGTIVVPTGYGFAVTTAIQSATIKTADNDHAVNPLYTYASRIAVVEEPMINVLASEAGLSTVPWFMAADKGDARGIQIDYLNGNKTPSIVRSQKPGTAGITWDVLFDWGITVLDYRGLARNDGAAIGSNF